MIDYIIGFFKVIAIFLLGLIPIIGLGYLINAIFKPLKIRSVGVLLSIALYVTLFVFGFFPLKIAPIILFGVYIAGFIGFMIQEKTFKREFKEIDFIKSDIDLAWSALYSYLLPATLLSNQSLVYMLPFSVDYLEWYLYAYVAFIAFAPAIMISQTKDKISKIHKKILQVKAVTANDILEIIECKNEEDLNDEDKKKEFNKMLEILEHFERKNIVKKINLEDDFPAFLEIGFYESLENDITPLLNSTKLIKAKELIVTLQKKYKIDAQIIHIGFEHILYSFTDWVEFNEVYLIESYIDEIIREIDKQFKAAGDYNAQSIANTFKIPSALVKDIIEYRYYEYKNLGFVNKTKNFTPDTTKETSNISQPQKQTVLEDISAEVAVKVDINHCSESELANIRGIGVALAKKAVKRRREKNGFASTDELIEYLGLNPHIAETVQAYISCSPIDKIAINNTNFPGRRMDF